MMSPQKICILSPHLDDAIFSCGKFILENKNHHKIFVYTVFSSYKNLNKSFSFTPKNINANTYQKIRKNEDEKAMNLLKLNYTHLDFIDAACRGTYTIWENIFSGSILPEDEKIIEKLTLLLKSIESQFDIFFIPFGIGKHIDHLISKKAARRAIPKKKIFYYVDYPYVCIKKNWNIVTIVNILLARKKIVFLETKQKHKLISMYSSQESLLRSQLTSFPEIIFQI